MIAKVSKYVLTGDGQNREVFLSEIEDILRGKKAEMPAKMPSPAPKAKPVANEPKKIDLSPFLAKAIAVYKSMFRLSKKVKTVAADNKMNILEGKIRDIIGDTTRAQGLIAGTTFSRGYDANRKIIEEHALKTLSKADWDTLRMWHTRYAKA
jgi:hypothetical protein